MTSSLVGSEMCIRDRASNRDHLQDVALNQRGLVCTRILRGGGKIRGRWIGKEPGGARQFRGSDISSPGADGDLRAS
eukprot:10147213-Prorocentrum_lima.AAC.1